MEEGYEANHAECERRRPLGRRREDCDPGSRPARADAADRLQGLLRGRPVRVVHGDHQRQARPLLHHGAGEGAGRRQDRHDRRPRSAGEPASAAGRLDGAWRRAVRRLHAGLHHVRQGAARPQSVADPRGGARLVQPQPQSLPLHRLQAAGRRGDGRGRDAARRADRRPGDGQGEGERLDPRHALSASIRARQGHGNVGLRRRYRPAHAARHAPSGADAGEGVARPHQGYRHQRSREDAGRREGHHLEGREGQERHHRPHHLPDQQGRRLGSPDPVQGEGVPVRRRDRDRRGRHGRARPRGGRQGQGRPRSAAGLHVGLRRSRARRDRDPPRRAERLL